MNDFLIKTSKPVTIYSKTLTFRESNKSFKLDGDLLKTMTNYNFNVDHSNPQDRELFYEFGKELKFNIKHVGRKSPRDKTLLKLLKSLAIMAAGNSTIFLTENPNELCGWSKFLLQEKQPLNNAALIYEEIISLCDKLLEHKSISTKRRKVLQLKCSN